MIEVNCSDIERLSDVNLRILVGKLCEAELYSKGFSTSFVTYGGHHNAPDGGIDVKVDIKSPKVIEGFIPKSLVGYQVKKSDLNASQIREEIMQNGKFKPGIRALLEENGAYIIVVGIGVTDRKYRARIKALSEIFDKHEKGKELTTEFFDSQRIATWVNSHPGIILWVKEKLGKPILGWHSYTSWASKEIGEYFTSDFPCFKNPYSKEQNEYMTLEQGIQEIRACVISKSKHVRLVGLSGVGKTRFLQALFEHNVGTNFLDKNCVLYTDTNFNPIPNPIHILEQLRTTNESLVLIVDNCDSKLHKTLCELSKLPESKISIVTTEYDINQDEPNETNVYRIEAIGDDIIRNILSSQFPHIPFEIVSSIVSNSGGNARVAISIANTIKKGEDVSGIRDEDLFNRIFYQKKSQDNGLLRSAEALSLVYSFKFSDELIANDELSALSNFADESISDMYKHVIELEKRDLIQKRSQWRALLPHAIANTLAKKTLERTPLTSIIAFIESCNHRLIKSIFHRLSFLYSSTKAISVAQAYLSQNSEFQNLKALDEYKIEILDYLSNLCPESVLLVLERIYYNNKPNSIFLSRQNPHYYKIARLIKYIAYDRLLFNRCMILLSIICRSENNNEKVNTVSDLIKPLFHIRQSNTEASPQQRIECVKNLLSSDISKDNLLGIELLTEILETRKFGSIRNNVNRNRILDSGYYPKTSDEALSWFKNGLTLLEEVSKQIPHFLDELVSSFSKKINGLWRVENLQDYLITVIRNLNEKSKWFQLWVSVAKMVRYDQKYLGKESLVKASQLALSLSPVQLFDKARVFSVFHMADIMILTDPLNRENASNEIEETKNAIIKLGKEVGINEVIPEDLILDILRFGREPSKHLGHGVAKGSKDLRQTWNQICDGILECGPVKANLFFVSSFLSESYKLEPLLTHAILDEILEDLNLNSRYLVYQNSIPIDDLSYERIVSALNKKIIKPFDYIVLTNKLLADSVKEQHLAHILKLMLREEEGIVSVAKIISYKFEKENNTKIKRSIREIGQSILLKCPFNTYSVNEYHINLELIYSYCVEKNNSYEITKQISKNLYNSASKRIIRLNDFKSLINACSKKQAFGVLDGILEEYNEFTTDTRSLVRSEFDNRWSIFNSMPIENIITWCKVDVTYRTKMLAALITPECLNNNTFSLSPLSKELLILSDNPTEILDEYYNSFNRNVWSGNKSDILSERLPIFDELLANDKPKIREWALKKKPLFVTWIMSQIESEKNDSISHHSNYSFE